MKLSTCFLMSLFFIETKGCQTRKRRPENSLVSCVFEKIAEYTHCRYACRPGYYFKDLVEEKVQLCINDTWIPEDIGNCIPLSSNGSLTRNKCYLKPKQPKSAHCSCSFDRKSTQYKSCAYFCAKGSYFEGKTAHKLQTCINGSWVPKEIGDCDVKTRSEKSCSSRPRRPKNSLSVCKFDKDLSGYATCTYSCKDNYYFHGEVNEKTQICVKGRWIPEKLGDCVDETKNYSPSALACFVKPGAPKKSSGWCNFDNNLGAYTECTYTCNTGYHFDGTVSEKARVCVHGQWVPEELEDCSDQRKKYAVGVGPCSSRPHLPKNSFVYCTMERGSVVKRNCTYTCRENYYFPDMTSVKTQRCVNDTWGPVINLGDCLNPSRSAGQVERACSSVPAKRPRNSVTYFSYNGSLSGFTDSKYVCFVGYSFQGSVNERTQFCANGSWIPDNVGDCV